MALSILLEKLASFKTLSFQIRVNQFKSFDFTTFSSKIDSIHTIFSGSLYLYIALLLLA